MKKNKAFLGTEGNVEYKDYKIEYYTYSFEKEPQAFYVNASVDLHEEHRGARFLPIESKAFDQESDAINFAIEEGKKFIDSQ